MIAEVFDVHVDKEKLPNVVLTISADKRVDILLSLYNNVRNSIHHWEDRIYNASIWSSGIVLSAVAFFWHDYQSLAKHRFILTMAVFLFGLITQIYLYYAEEAHNDNGRALVKIEAALELCHENKYFEGIPFFGFSGEWVPNRRALPLRITHATIVVISIVLINLFYLGRGA